MSEEKPNPPDIIHVAMSLDAYRDLIGSVIILPSKKFAKVKIKKNFIILEIIKED